MLVKTPAELLLNAARLYREDAKSRAERGDRKGADLCYEAAKQNEEWAALAADKGSEFPTAEGATRNLNHYTLVPNQQICDWIGYDKATNYIKGQK